MYGKQTSTSHNITFEKDRQPLELVHSDVCGPCLLSLLVAHLTLSRSLTMQLEKFGFML